MMTVTNIIILSTLFGGVLTKDLGGLRENELPRDTSRWKSANTGGDDGRDMENYDQRI